MIARQRTMLLASTSAIAFDSGYSPTPADVAAARENNIRQSTVETDEMLKRSQASAGMLNYWDKADTIIDGIDAMRLAGEVRLPKFTDESAADYKFRLASTKMTNIYKDIVESLAAKPFEQEVSLPDNDDQVTPDQIAALAENVDGSGCNLTAFASQVFFNAINSAIHWIMIDYTRPTQPVLNKADEKRLGMRSFWSHVLGRNILDANSEMINGQETLTYVKIFEPGQPDKVRIFERSLNGEIEWSLYQKQDHLVDGKTRFLLIETGILAIDVIPLVPFYTGRRDGRTWRIFPTLESAADLQIELYQMESALKFAKILAAYPMLSGNGVKPEKDESGKIKKLSVGPGRVLYAPSDNAGNVGRWEYVEPNAGTLKFLADDIKENQMQLRELGKQPLTAQSGNLTVITTAYAAGKSKSAVCAWALSLKNSLENALVISCKWENITPETYDPVANVYTEFDEFIDGKDYDALATARAAKDLSQETYWHELQRRGLLSSEFDDDIERERLLAELPGDPLPDASIEGE